MLRRKRRRIEPIQRRRNSRKLLKDLFQNPVHLFNPFPFFRKESSKRFNVSFKSRGLCDFATREVIFPCRFEGNEVNFIKETQLLKKAPDPASFLTFPDRLDRKIEREAVSFKGGTAPTDFLILLD